MILGVLNQKGGVGKSTLAVNIAATFAMQGQRVLLVDSDPQGSSLAWQAAREREPLFPVVGMPKPTLHKDLPEISRDYDAVVIDGAPRVNDLARSAIMASDLVVVPIQPSPYDVWASAEIVALLKEAVVYKESLKSVIAISRKIANTAIGRDVQEAIEPFELPVLRQAITQRVAWAESAAQGLSILERPEWAAAAGELGRLVSELSALDQREAA